MKERRLTDKQEKFCLAVANGHTQYEAYKIAYDTKTENRQVVDNNAYLVGKNPKIRARVEELRKMRDNKDLYDDINDINKRFRLIWECIEDCISKGDHANVRGYLSEIAKLKGDYVTTIRDISDNKKAFEGMSTDDIKAMLNTDAE